MRRSTIALALAVCALAAAPAAAITNGAPDGNAHPEVGALLAQQAFPDGTWEECTGTLIAPQVFLTAAHCDEGVSRVAVTFDSTYNSATGTTFWGTYVADPRYSKKQADPNDIAVVLLDRSPGIAPAGLPAAGSLSGVNTRTQFTPVGYGAQLVTQGGGKKVLHYADVRYATTGTLNSLNPNWLHVSMNPSHGDGGTCYGDSGGPNFLGAGAGETNIVAATTITGDEWCRSTNVDYRMDTPSARSFLASYVALP